MSENALQVEIRQASGKGVARKLRAAGRIPGVCYRRGATSVPIDIDRRALDRLLRSSSAGMNTLIDLRVSQGGEFDGQQVLIKEMQRDPVSGEALHADLFAVDLTQVIEVAVPIHVRGIAHGVTMGGVLDQPLRELDIECLPNAIPEEIVLDATALDIGDSVHVRDLTLPEGVTLVSDPDLSVVSVAVPAAIEEETPAEAEGEGELEGEAAEGAAEGEGAAPAEGAEAKEEKGGD